MNYIESPNTYRPIPGERSIFLAGGITGTPNWQQDIVQLLRGKNLIIFNPRRPSFPINDHNAAKEQILWEYEYLRIANEILFWFPHESLCPIALYELGAWSMTEKQIYIGMHPDYRRRLDIEIQISLVRPNIKIVYSLPELARLIIESND